LYSFIKGPGTLGIDSSGELLEVTSTIFEALDYYGIYSITRPSQCSRESIEEMKIQEEPRNGEEIVQENDENVNSNIQNHHHHHHHHHHHSQIKKTKSIELEDIREFAEEESSSSTTQAKVMKRKKHNDRRSSTRFIKSGNNSDGNNNDDVLTPMEPEDVIVNRRISMGVYGMYSKFM
jgi:ABC-type nickel/cobalt efflux system permease component RcnA